MATSLGHCDVYAGQRAQEAALIDRLLDARVMVSHRYTSGVGGVRASCHFFNRADDVARLLEVTGEWLSASGRAR